MEANKNRKWLQNEGANIGNLWKREQALQLIGLLGVEILDNRDGGTGGALHTDFGRSVHPISTRGGANYTSYIFTRPSPLDFQTLLHPWVRLKV